MYSAFLLVVSVLLAVRMRTVSCGIVDDQACAKHVHQQCKCNIALDFKGNKRSTKHLCKKLQSCADCMAIPRCNSDYVDQFRALLQTTFIISKQAKICPNINFEKFYGGGKGKRGCKGNGKVYDHCGNQCQCQDGSYTDCFRVRKEFTQMSFEERRWFVDAYYKATTDPFLKDDFQKLLNGHAEIPTDFLHHMPQIFFPWHRWFLLQAENFLRQVDCRVTIPYYQWTAAGKNVFRTTNPKDVWNGGPQGLGGNGVPPSYCVQDGKFREGEWRLPASKGGGCLRRDFNKKCVLFKEKQLHKLLRLHSNSFKYFEKTVREELHAKFHDCIGGNMPDSMKAGNTPEVLLHHSFMDEIWDQWQERGDWFKYQYFTTLNFKMPLADMYPWQFLDNNNLPGNIGVIYERFKKSPLEGNKKIPRDRTKPGDEQEFWDDQEQLSDEGEVMDPSGERKKEIPRYRPKSGDEIEEETFWDDQEPLSDEGEVMEPSGERKKKLPRYRPISGDESEEQTFRNDQEPLSDEGNYLQTREK